MAYPFVVVPFQTITYNLVITTRDFGNYKQHNKILNQIYVEKRSVMLNLCQATYKHFVLIFHPRMCQNMSRIFLENGKLFRCFD